VLNLGAANTWDNAALVAPSVLLDNGIYQMWYEGNDGANARIGYAVSLDGVVWTKYARNPVLNLGTNGTWEDVHVFRPFVLLDNGVYQMWYNGHDGTNARIGYATSTPPPPPTTDQLLVLEGAGNSVEIADHPSLDITNAITVEGWFRLLSAPSGTNKTAIRKEGAFALEPQNPAEGSGNSFGLALWFFGNDIRVDATTPVLVGAWTHVAGVYDGSQMRVYLNGQLAATRDIRETINTSNEPLIFGRYEEA
jgi:hypothetical protein